MIVSNSRKHSKPNLVDKVYCAFSIEFWLSIATVGIATDWVLKFGSNSLLITLAWAGILGTYLVFTNRTVEKFWYKFRTVKAPQHVALLVAGMTILFSLFLINCMTEPSHALIITANGTTQMANLLSGASFGFTAPGAGLTSFGAGVVILIKVIFALAFLFGLYGSYQKYQERAELQEIVQAPIVLIVVVLALDGFIGLIFP